MIFIKKQTQTKPKQGARRKNKREAGVSISSFEGIFFFPPSLKDSLVEIVLEFNLGRSTWVVETLKAVAVPCVEPKARGHEGQGTL